MKEMALWASLSHQNILPFLGFDTGLWPSLALISPMILGGTAPSYLLMNPSADRLKIVSTPAVHFREFLYPCSSDFWYC